MIIGNCMRCKDTPFVICPAFRVVMVSLETAEYPS